MMVALLKIVNNVLKNAKTGKYFKTIYIILFIIYLIVTPLINVLNAMVLKIGFLTVLPKIVIANMGTKKINKVNAKNVICIYNNVC